MIYRESSNVFPPPSSSPERKEKKGGSNFKDIIDVDDAKSSERHSSGFDSTIRENANNCGFCRTKAWDPAKEQPDEVDEGENGLVSFAVRGANFALDLTYFTPREDKSRRRKTDSPKHFFPAQTNK